jgi:uncharacterized membrane protein YoaK (UPF0700 family)
MRVTRLNIAAEIAVTAAVWAVLVYELVYSELVPRIAAFAVFVVGALLCRVTVRWLRDHPGELGKVQLAIALAVGSSFVFADRLPRTTFLLLCAFVAGYLTSALVGLRSELRPQGGA